MKDERLTVLVLFGGTSTEHEVSCKSAASILQNIDQEKYQVRTIGITKQGKWIETSASPEKIADGTWVNKINNRTAYICPDRTVHGIRTERGKVIHIDVVLPILHGKDGEDGVMQGLLELSGIPYVGSGVLASACSMDKAVTKVIVDQTNIRQAKYYVTTQYKFVSGPSEEILSMEKTLGDYPYFVKPANAGSSIGITKVHNQMELFEGIKLAMEYDTKVVVEETIVGREVEVAVLGNRTPHASPVGEIQSAGEFYDFESKYENAASIAELAENLTEEQEANLQKAAVEIYQTMGCRGLSRVDFFLCGDEVVFNEINTLPGFTKISMYPKLWGSADIGYSELIDRLIQLALEDE